MTSYAGLQQSAHERSLDSSAKRQFSTSMESRLSPIVVLYLFCVVIPIGFNLGPLYLTSLRLILILLIIPLAIRLLMGHFGRVYVFDVLFFLHVLWMGLALWVNSPEQMVTQIGSVGAEFLGGYLVGRAYVRDRGSFLSLCRALVLIVLCCLPFALYESRTGRPLIVEFLGRLPGSSTVPIVTIEGRMGLERVQGSFAHPIHFGLFCSVAFSLCFVALQGTYSITRRLVTSLLIMLSGFLALSSGALLAMALQVALIAWSIVFGRLQWRWWLLVGLFVIAYVVVDILSNRTPIRVFMSYATFSAHNAYWRGIIFEWGLKNVFGSPAEAIPPAMWFGIGMADWVRPWFMHSGSMDNFWLVVTVRYGVPGFVLLVLGYVIAISRVMRRDFSSDRQISNIRRAWVFTFLGLTFTLCTVHVWTNIASFVFFMFGAGIWLIAEQVSQAIFPSTQKNRYDAQQAGPNEPKQEEKRHGRAPHTRFPTNNAITR